MTSCYPPSLLKARSPETPTDSLVIESASDTSRAVGLWSNRAAGDTAAAEVSLELVFLDSGVQNFSELHNLLISQDDDGRQLEFIESDLSVTYDLSSEY